MQKRYLTDSELIEAVDFIANIDNYKYKWLEKDKFCNNLCLTLDNLLVRSTLGGFAASHIESNEYGVVRFFKYVEPKQIDQLPDHIKNKILMIIVADLCKLDRTVYVTFSKSRLPPVFVIWHG